MDDRNVFTKEMASHGLWVAGLIIIFGYVFYGSEIYSPGLWPSQFLLSGITLGVANAFFRTTQYRNGLAALLVWHVISISLFMHPIDWWNYLLSISYLVGMAGSVYLFYVIVRRPSFARRYQQIIASSVLLGVVNCLLVVALSLSAPRWIFHHLGSLMQAMHLNLKVGILLGLLFGLGNLGSDTMLAYFGSKEKVEPE